MKEIIALLWIYLKVKIFTWIEYCFVIIKYYPRFSFFKIDLTLLFSYFLINPFRVNRQFLQSQGKTEIYTYGETPLTTLDLIAHRCGIVKEDTVFELGCGRGRSCFWLHQFIGCSVIGVDHCPLFIEKGEKVRERFCLKELSFQLGDLFEVDLSEATVIYLYGTCFSNAEIGQLIRCFHSLTKGTKVITISYSLKEIDPNAPFLCIQQFPAYFMWGKGDVYLQIKM